MIEEERRIMLEGLKKRKQSHRKNLEERMQKLVDMGYMDKTLDITIAALIETHPIVEILISREMFWSRCRECEEAIKIVRGDE